MATAIDTNSPSQSLLDAVNGTKNTALSDASATQDRFLKLLVEQMKNQDPLNPMDNAAVTSQMAQLSTVTGIDKLNASLAAMAASAKSNEALQASSLIGHQALVSGNQIHFDGKAGGFGVELPSNVDALNVTVTDATGKVLKEYALGAQNAGVVPLSWDGVDSTGGQASKGDYKFTVKATKGGNAATANTLSLEEISSITSSSSGVKLQLSNNTSATVSDLKQIF